MERYKINRRVNKKLHKYYKFYTADIWGRLAVRSKDNTITRRMGESMKYYIYSIYRGNRKITIPPEISAELRMFNKLKYRGETRTFHYILYKRKHIKKPRTFSFRGKLLRDRKLISLFYGGGRIRKKTFRRYGKMLRSGVSFVSVLESRIDVLLFRANFVDTIYQSRNFVRYGNVKLRGYKGIKNPGYLVKPYVAISLIDDSWCKMRNILIRKIIEQRIIMFPSYLYINFAIMLFFIIGNIKSAIIKYPFSTESRTLSVFRHLWRLM